MRSVEFRWVKRAEEESEDVYGPPDTYPTIVPVSAQCPPPTNPQEKRVESMPFMNRTHDRTAGAFPSSNASVPEFVNNGLTCLSIFTTLAAKQIFESYTSRDLEPCRPRIWSSLIKGKLLDAGQGSYKQRE